jgi:hypothetical protein
MLKAIGSALDGAAIDAFGAFLNREEQARWFLQAQMANGQIR